MAKDKAWPSTEEPEVTADKSTPRDLAMATGNMRVVTPEVRIGGDPNAVELFTWQHNAAAALHGWRDHEHHAGAPIQLSREDYEAALKAVEAPKTRSVGKDGTRSEPLTDDEVKKLNGTKPLVSDYEPHKPALSKYSALAAKES